MTGEIPKTLEEAFKKLQAHDGVVAWLCKPEKEAMGVAHHGIGTWMRNTWGLWGKEGELYEALVGLGLDHADDMSGLILTSFHRNMNGKELKIIEQVQHYLDHWAEMEKN